MWAGVVGQDPLFQSDGWLLITFLATFPRCLIEGGGGRKGLYTNRATCSSHKMIQGKGELNPNKANMPCLPMLREGMTRFFHNPKGLAAPLLFRPDSRPHTIEEYSMAKLETMHVGAKLGPQIEKTINRCVLGLVFSESALVDSSTPPTTASGPCSQ
jgi:hypothetical protein